MMHIDDMEDFEAKLCTLQNASVCHYINVTRPFIEKEQTISHFKLEGWRKELKLWTVWGWSTNPVWRSEP